MDTHISYVELQEMPPTPYIPGLCCPSPCLPVGREEEGGCLTAWSGELSKSYQHLAATATETLATAGACLLVGTAVATLPLQDHRIPPLPTINNNNNTMVNNTLIEYRCMYNIVVKMKVIPFDERDLFYRKVTFKNHPLAQCKLNNKITKVNSVSISIPVFFPAWVCSDICK